MKFEHLIKDAKISPAHKKIARLKKYFWYYKIKSRVIVKWCRVKRALAKWVKN